MHIFNFLTVVLSSRPEYKDLCNFVTRDYANYWKQIGVKLGLRKVKLDTIEKERFYQSECCNEMLGHWLNFDVNASWKKIQEVIQSFSDIEPIAPTSDPVVTFKKYLQKRYDNERIIDMVNIAFICHEYNMVTSESVTAVAKAMYYGNIVIDDKQLNSQYSDYYTRCVKSTNILEVLKDLNSTPDREPFLLLIEGVQGIGKTTVCREIAFHWARQQGLDGQFTFLICLHTATSGNINSLETFLEYLCCEKLPAFQNISKILYSSRGDKVMVIIDGYEKLPDQHKNSADSFIHKIIRREISSFQQCDLVISSCHTASVKLYKYPNCTRIELLGFTEEVKQQYLKLALNPCAIEVDELTAYLGKHSSLNSLCCYPLCLNELISLFRECKSHKKKLPNHETKLINIIANRIVLHLSESQEKNFLPLTDEFNRIPEENQLILLKISKLAYLTLQTNACKENCTKDSSEECVYKLENIKSGINAADVKKCFLNGLGFLKGIISVENTDINQALFTFLHISLQEFLAAVYISTLSQNECTTIWKETFFKASFLNVWAYYLGITEDFKFLKNKLCGSLSSWLGVQTLPDEILNNKTKCLYLVHCLLEFPNNKIYKIVKPKVIPESGILDLSYTETDFNIVVFFLSHCVVQQWTHLDLSNCCIDDTKLAYFLQQLQPFLTSLPIIKNLNLSNNQLSKVSLNNVFEIAANFGTIDIILAHNKTEDHELCESIVTLPKKSDNFKKYKIKIIKSYKSSFLLSSQDLLWDFKLVSSLTSLYIIRCSLENEVLDGLLKTMKSCEALLLVMFYDNKINCSGMVNILDEFIALNQLRSVLMFDKMLSDIDINMDELPFQYFLLNTNSKLLAHNIYNHQILMALEYNPSIVNVQLNNCLITDEVMSKMAIILNNSSQQWNLLDLSNNEIDDHVLKEFCNALNDSCIVDVIKLTRNRLTSSSLIVELIQHLQPNTIDICGNSFTTDDSKSETISMFIAIELFTYHNPLCLTLTCDNGNTLICHGLNNTAVLTTKELVTNVYTHVFVNDSTLSSELLKRSLDGNDLLTFLHLGHVKWIGEPFYESTSFFKKNIFFSICENCIPEEILVDLLNRFDSNINVSMIVSTDDIFISHKCNDGLLKWHVTQKLLPLPPNKRLSYIGNCLIEKKPQNSNVTTDFVSKLNLVTEIMLYNNDISPKNVLTIATRLQRLKMPKSIFVYELQKQTDGNMIIKCLIKEKVIIAKQATSEQVSCCFSLDLPTATTLRFIGCCFNDEHYNTLVNALTNNHDTPLKEFSLYECNTNDVRTKQLAVALQVKSTLTSLLFSCSKVTPLEADSIATALSAVINNNPTLEKVSLKFDNLHSSACIEIFRALANTNKLKHLRFCDAHVTNNEAINQLKIVIANNSLLEILNLKNNRFRSSGVKVIAEAFENIHHLKILALNGNQIDDNAADDIASIIANNIKLEKLLLHNNALRFESISTICQSLKGHGKLQVFRISQNHIQEEAADDIADMIDHNPSLQVVDVGRNRLLTRGVIKLTKSLEKLTSIQKLSLNENNITYTEKVAASIARIIKNNKHLKVLHLDNNNFSTLNISPIAKELNTLIGLRELTINNTGCTADNITAMITNNLLLEILDIGDNKLKTKGISVISKALTRLSHLKVLGLYGNEITDDTADDIAEVIYKLPLLEKLLLNNNAFGVAGIKTMCKSLEHNGTLKLLQLDNVGITEEVADNIAAVIDNNSLVEFLYLGNNWLQSFGTNVILTSLNRKKNFKALALNNNNISEDVVDNIVHFVTSNPDLEELFLNNNSIGTKGVIRICECVKDNNALKVINLADNNVSNEAVVPIVSAVESNTTVEKLSLSNDIILMLDNNKLSNIIASLVNLKYLQINCKVVTEGNIYELVDLIFAKGYVQEITINYVLEEMHFLKEMHFLSPLTSIEAVVVIKTNLNEIACYMPPIHSVVINDRVEIVCTKDNVLVNSKIAQLIKKGFERLILVFTKTSYYTDQEIDFLTGATTVNYKSIDSLIISKLNANKYNSDISGVVIIEESEIIVMLTGNSLDATGITKLLNKVENISNLMLYTERMSIFTSQNIIELTDIISKTSKLKKFEIRRNAIFAKAVNDYLTKSITFKTVSTLNTLNIRCFDFTHKDKKSAAVSQESDKHWWHKLFTMLKRNVDLKALNLSGTAINEGVEQHLSYLLNETTKLEKLSLEDCSLKISLKYIYLHRTTTTLRYLDLSNNHLIDVEPIVSILECNTNLETLVLDKNCLQESAGDKLGVAIGNLRKLKTLCLDENMISKNIALAIILKFTTTFSATADERLRVCINHHEDLEVICAESLLENITTLILCKSYVEKEDASFLATISKTGVVLSLWQQDNALKRAAGFTRLLSAYKIITTIELINVSCRRLTEQEEDAIATIIRENTQLEKVLLGSQSYKSVIDDMNAFYSAYNIDSKTKHDKPDPTLESITASLYLSHKFLFKLISALQYHTELKTLDLSFCPITEELRNKLATVLSISTKLKKLLLGNCSLDNGGVKIIGNSLRNITTLKHLDLSSNNISEEDLILAIIQVNTQLEELYLEKNDLNSTTDNGLNASVANLKNLQVLSVDLKVFSSNLMTAFANTIGRTLLLYNCDYQRTEVNKMIIRGSFNNINALTLCKVPIESEGQLVQTFMLENGSLMLWWNQSYIPSSKSIMRFLSAFKNITTIKLLDFSASDFSQQEIDTIATVFTEIEQLENLWMGIQSADTIIEDFSTLKKVQLQGDFKKPYANFENHFKSAYENQLEQFVSAYENQFKQYFSILKHDYSGHHLKDLMSSRKLRIFPSKLLSRILSALPYNIDLKTVDLSAYVITEEIAKLLAVVLGNSTRLDELILQDCSLGNKGVEIIADAVILKNITTLKHLTLSSNNITEIVPIVNILQINTKLTNIYFHQNHLNPSAGYIISVCALKLKYLEVLSIDQNIISRYMSLQLANAFTTNARMLLLYNHEHHITEMMKIRGSLPNINVLTLHKAPTARKNQPIIAIVLENGSVLLQWSQSNELKKSGILKFLSSFKITTIKLLNNSENELTELEVDTIATIISENDQLENVWFGSHSLKTINDDFVILAGKKIKEDEMQNKIMQFTLTLKNDRCANQLDILPFPPKKKMLLKIIHALCNTVDLKTLDLSGNVITEESAEQLAIVLARSTRLKALFAENCSLQTVSMSIIVKSLQKTASLKQLNLSRNEITKETIDSIFTMIKFNSKLELLYLDSQSLKSDQLLNFIRHLSSLKELQIDSRLLFEDTRYELINTIMSNPKLQWLITINHSFQMCGLLNISSFSSNPKSLVIICTCCVQHHLLALADLKSSEVLIEAANSEALLATGILRAVNLFQDETVYSNALSNTLKNSSNPIVNETGRIENFKNLEKFKIIGNISYLVAMHIYLRVLAQSKSLNELCLYDNKIDENAANLIATIIANNEKIQALTIHNCYLNSHGAKSIMLSLKNVSTLTELSLYSNFITDDAADDIADVILHNNAMEKFIIGGNTLRAKGMVKILLSLKELKFLKDLSISSNDVSQDITNYIIPVIIANPQLTDLDLAKIHLQVDDTVNIFKTLKLSYLTYLSISRTNLCQKGVCNITALISNCVALEHLRANENAIGTVGVMELSTALATLKKLKRIDFADNNFTCTSTDSIAEVIVSHYSLESLILGGDCIDGSVGIKLPSLDNMHPGLPLNGVELLFLSNKMLQDKEYTKFSGAKMCNYLSTTNDFNVFEVSKVCIKTIKLMSSSSIHSNCLVCLSKLNHNKIKSDGAINKV